MSHHSLKQIIHHESPRPRLRSERDLNPKFNAKVVGVTVPLCCGGCKAKVEKEKDVEKKVELVFNNIIFSKHYAISVGK